MPVKFLKYNGTGGYAQEQEDADELNLGRVTTLGVSGVGMNAAGNRIVGVGPTVDPSDVATKAYVDAVANGIDWKESVRAVSTSNITLMGLQTIDGVSIQDGERVLVAGQTLAEENGIYIANTLNWFRSGDTDPVLTAGMATFIEEGTVWSDTAWALITDNPIIVGATPLTFSQIAGINTPAGGQGILKTGNVLDVELDTLANAQGSGSDGGSSGLEFDVTGSTGKLRARVNPTGGLSRTSTGLSILLNGASTTLATSGLGLRVVGLPSLFLINNVAVGATVTSPALDAVTNGSNANGYHYHQNSSQQWTASGAIAKGVGVYISGNDVVSTGDSTDSDKSRIIGVAGAAIASTFSGPVLTTGTVTAVLIGATAGTPYYLSSTGAPILYSAIPSGERVVRLGFARNATDLEVRIQDYGLKS